MTVEPIDLPAVLGVIVGGLFILIPTIGLTVRFALKPVLEAIANLRDAHRERLDVDQLARRVAALERQLEGIRPPGQIPARVSPLPELPESKTSTKS